LLFDTHAHFNDESYTPAERLALIERIKNSEVEYVVDVAFDVDSAKIAASDAKNNDFIYATAGVLPQYVDSLPESALDEIEEIAKADKVVAIGEIGLDYHKNRMPPEPQKQWFRKFIRLAKRLAMPVVIHDREAHEDVFDILKEENAFDGAGVLLHCYSGDLALAEMYVEHGAVLSIAGPVTFKNAKELQKVAATIPLKHLVIETDAPYLTPEPFRGKKNDPSKVKFVAQKIAVLKDISYEEVARITNENARAFYGI
jgi:TatD DNase family protein